MALAGCVVVTSMTACGVQQGDDVGGEASAIEGTQQVGKKVKVDGDGLRLRTGPSTRRTVVGLLYKGDEVEVVQAEPTDGFYKVKVLTLASEVRAELAGKEGWVAGQFLLDDAAPASTAEGEQLGPVEGEQADGGPSSATCEVENTTAATASVLEDFTDHRSFRFRDTMENVPLGAREAWFKFGVKDEGLNGNPVLRVFVKEGHEVSVFYACKAGGDASTCSTGAAVTEGSRTGCKAAGTVDLAASCNTTDESGAALVRVRRKAGDTNTCSTFTMTIEVN
jgi:hypothetical protein